jgi:hypothetical protein
MKSGTLCPFKGHLKDYCWGVDGVLGWVGAGFGEGFVGDGHGRPPFG